MTKDNLEGLIKEFNEKFPELMDFRPMKGIKGATSRNMKPEVIKYLNKAHSLGIAKERERLIKEATLIVASYSPISAKATKDLIKLLTKLSKV